jgi:hypothetical protein
VGEEEEYRDAGWEVCLSALEFVLLAGDEERTATDMSSRDKEYLDSITPEVVHYVQGRLVTVEGEDDEPEEEAKTEAKAEAKE